MQSESPSDPDRGLRSAIARGAERSGNVFYNPLTTNTVQNPYRVPFITKIQSWGAISFYPRLR
jgi:hypothetical protein